MAIPRAALCCAGLFCVALLCGGPLLVAQTPTEQVSGPGQAVQVPLSGQAEGQGGVTVMQGPANAAGGSGSSVNSLNSTLSVQPPYNGSVPTGPVSSQVKGLTLDDALHQGLRYNLGQISESNMVAQARGQEAAARSTLLPQLNAAAAEAFERENLRTLGVSLPSVPTAVKFNYVDARVRLQQSVFDLVRNDNLRSASESLKASLSSAKNARDLIVLAVAGSYLQLISTDARVVAAEAQVTTAKTIAQQARDRFAAGLAARVDQTRQQVQEQSEQQQLVALRADRDTEKLALARLIGMPLGQEYHLADDFRFTPLEGYTLESALQQAFTGRQDLQAAQAGIRAAEQSAKATHAERLPNLAVNADFGGAGVTPTNHSTGVYTVYGELTVPIYEGGRIKAEEAEADAAVRQRKAEFENLRGQVEEDVRQAFINLNAAAEQVGVARSNQQLAHESLQQSQDRFAAGVADTVELVQAEQAVVAADNDFITAVYQHNLAKVSLARAMGNAEQTLPQMLRK